MIYPDEIPLAFAAVAIPVLFVLWGLIEYRARKKETDDR